MTMRFIVLGDLHYSVRPGRDNKQRGAARERFFDALFAQVGSHQADLVIAVGDCAHYSTPFEYERLLGLARQHGVELVSVFGNHDADYTDKAKVANYFLGGRVSAGSDGVYTAFETDEAYFILLDSARTKSKADWSGYLGAAQLQWLAGQIDYFNQHGAGKTLVIAVHHPLANTTQGSGEKMLQIVNSGEVYRLLDKLTVAAPHLVFCGHNHTNSIFGADERGFTYVQSGCPMTCLSYRIVTLEPTVIKLETVDFDALGKGLENDRLQTAKSIPDFWIPEVSFVAGQADDRRRILMRG